MTLHHHLSSKHGAFLLIWQDRLLIATSNLQHLHGPVSTTSLSEHCELNGVIQLQIQTILAKRNHPIPRGVVRAVETRTELALAVEIIRQVP